MSDMLLIVGNKLSCEELRFNNYKVLELRENVCNITYNECWKIDEGEEVYDVECACKEFNYEDARNVAYQISKIPNVELIAVTPSPFMLPWGPANIIDVPIRELWVREGVFDKEIVEICMLALASIPKLCLLQIYVYPFLCNDLVKGEISEERLKKDGLSYVKIEGRWNVIRYDKNTC